MLDYERFMPMVKRIASSVSRNFPSSVQASDTEGAIYVWLFQRKAWIEQTVRDDPDNWEPKISSLMRKVAFDHCAQEKATIEGYDVSDNYRYSAPKIQTLLRDVFNYQDWQSFGNWGDGQPTAKGQANETGDRIAELVDIKEALMKLKADQLEILILHYRDNYTLEGLSEELEVSYDAARARLRRAVTALQKLLGPKAQSIREGSQNGRRAVRSNAAWRAQAANQWEG